jgi:hypothetical protein
MDQARYKQLVASLEGLPELQFAELLQSMRQVLMACSACSCRAWTNRAVARIARAAGWSTTASSSARCSLAAQTQARQRAQDGAQPSAVASLLNPDVLETPLQLAGGSFL